MRIQHNPFVQHHTASSDEPSNVRFFIEGERRPGRHRFKSIQIPIAKFSGLLLTKNNLSEIFRLANEFTINTPYPLQDASIAVNGIVIFRPNHNGTHSIRQVRYVQEICDLVVNRGNQNARTLLNSFSEEEFLNLFLAAYFLRSGRVDESSHNSLFPDPYPNRSAKIYQQYAEQLGVSKEMIEWTSRLIKNACIPKEERDPFINSDPKSMFGYQVLTMAHELDLIRCNRKETIDSQTKVLIRNQLNYFIGGRYEDKKDDYVDQMMEFSKVVCKATGCSRKYDDHQGDPALFARCSSEGDTCWGQVQSCSLPRWD